MKKTKLIKTAGAIALVGAFALGTSNCSKPEEIEEIEKLQEKESAPKDSTTIAPFDESQKTMHSF